MVQAVGIMAKIVKQPTAAFNPFYGCAIMAIAIVIFVGIVSWSVYSLTKQDSESAKFAVDQPVKPVASRLDGASLEALKQRLQGFAAEVKAGKAATLELKVPELNALMEIAPDTGYGNFTEMIAFKEVKDGKELIADVCFPLNKMKFWEGKRYVVGQASFGVEMVKDAGPDLKLQSLTVPGKQVNPGFFEAFSGWHWLTPYHKLEALAPVMKAVKTIKITSTGVELSAQP